jgi:hypothetical protein
MPTCQVHPPETLHHTCTQAHTQRMINQAAPALQLCQVLATVLWCHQAGASLTCVAAATVVEQLHKLVCVHHVVGQQVNAPVHHTSHKHTWHSNMGQHTLADCDDLHSPPSGACELPRTHDSSMGIASQQTALTPKHTTQDLLMTR